MTKEIQIGRYIFDQEALTNFITLKEPLVQQAIRDLLPKYQTEFRLTNEYIELEVDRQIPALIGESDLEGEAKELLQEPLGELSGYDLFLETISGQRYSSVLNTKGVNIIAIRNVESRWARLTYTDRLLKEVAQITDLLPKDFISIPSLYGRDDDFFVRKEYNFVLMPNEHDYNRLLLRKIR